MNSYSVLAVDDEPFNLDLIKAAFHNFDNVEISYAKDGQETLNTLEKQDFDVILLDISMPMMSGIEVLTKIRQNPKHTTLPILMITASTEKEQECLTLGASDFISKPYDIDILCTRTINYAKLNNATKITNVMSVAIMLIISMTVITNVFEGNFYGSQTLGYEEKMLGMGSSQEFNLNNIFQDPGPHIGCDGGGARSCPGPGTAICAGVKK